MATPDAYAATSRIRRAEPHLRAAHVHRPEPPRTEITARDQEVVELAGQPFSARLADGWASFREAVGQTTFFLTDPNSWR